MHYAFKFFFCKFILPIVEEKSVMLPSIATQHNVTTIRLVIKVSHQRGRSVGKDAMLVNEMLCEFGGVAELSDVVLLCLLNLGVVPAKDFAIRIPRLLGEMGARLVVAVANFLCGDFGLVCHTRGFMPKMDKSTRAKMNYFQ